MPVRYGLEQCRCRRCVHNKVDVGGDLTEYNLISIKSQFGG